MIALVDCNNFYASCERVFNPKINLKPVIVLSNNDGCVIARSNEAKSLGVKMGQPAFQLRNLIDKYRINVFSTNFALYGDLSKRVMNVVSTEVKKMEVYSIDEAFLDFSDFASKERGIAIKNKIKKWTGIPVSVGIAKTKTLAKVASYIAKKHTASGVFIFKDEDLIDRALNILDVQDLWGIGRRNASKLHDFGIHTALQFKQTDSRWIKKHFSINGVRLQKELYGKACYQIETLRKRKANICTARSFSKEIKELNKLREVISIYANNCATKLRKEKSCCTTVSVFLSTNRFRNKKIQYNPYKSISLQVPTNDSVEIIKNAIYGLKMIYNCDFLYKKAGVVLGGIVPEEQIQLSLFDSLDRIKLKKINVAVDKVNSIMGRHTVKLAVEGNKKVSKLKQMKLSPCYTTRFSDILKVKC